LKSHGVNYSNGSEQTINIQEGLARDPLWKSSFHAVEKGLKPRFMAFNGGFGLKNTGFPHYGKLSGEFSTVWKTF
jgi:hypothetical protein